MENNADDRAVALARYIVKNSATVRSAAKANSVSKSTVHSDVTKRLQKIDGELYEKVREILDRNKQERHLRGGMATREKYSSIRNSQNLSVRPNGLPPRISGEASAAAPTVQL